MKYLIFLLLPCFNALFVVGAAAQTEIADSLIARADTLNGVVVTAKEIVRYDDHLLLYPNKNQRQHAANGFDTPPTASTW